jgi:hypothetical protein
MRMGKVAVSSDADAGERFNDGDDAPPGGGQVPIEPLSGTNSGGGLTRVTVNLNRQALHALETLSERTGYSKTDAINRALQVYLIVEELMRRHGGALSVTGDDGQVERIHII